MECSGCTLCCKLLDVPAIKKPAGTLCKHACNIGCSIYNTRPDICHTFECLWLQSPILGGALKPNQCGVIFELFKPQRTVVAIVDKGYSWKEDPVKLLIQQIITDGFIVWIIDGSDKHLLLPENETEESAHMLAKEAWRGKKWPYQVIQKT